jgi:hypothetical protein
MHIGGKVVGLDVALEQQAIGGLLRDERVEVGFRDDRSARTRAAAASEARTSPRRLPTRRARERDWRPGSRAIAIRDSG